MLILSILAYPVTFVPYMALCRFILAGSTHADSDGNILDATNEHLGIGWGKVFTALYFITIYPGMAIYAITITNTIIDFAAVQLHLGHMSRWIVAPLSVLGLMLLVNLGTKKIVKTMGIIVLPFIISIVFIGFMAIAHWNASMLATMTDFNGAKELARSTWKGLPLVIFAFSITSITSSFVVAQKRHYGEHAAANVSRILRVALLLVIATVLFFPGVASSRCRRPN